MNDLEIAIAHTRMRGRGLPTPTTAAASRLKDAVDLDTICDDLALVAHTALEPAHVLVWTSRRD
jgi:hypothetical protein